MEVSYILGSVIGKAYENQPKRDDDFIGKDGLLYCGKCRTRKQSILSLPDNPSKTYKVPVMCKCREEEYRREQEEMRKREEMERVARLKGNSLMDEKFRSTTFDKFEIIKENTKLYKMCLRYAEHFDEMAEKNQGLLLYGPVGTGKSFAAACIANYLLDRMVPVVMTSFVKILQSVQFFSGEDAEQKFINRMNEAKLLIIDDLGAERNTDFALEKVYNIIDSRYRAKKPLILTTNLSLMQMQETTDIRYSRIYDRIFEMCYPVEFNGPSWRKEEAAKRYEEMTKFLEGEA